MEAVVFYNMGTFPLYRYRALLSVNPSPEEAAAISKDLFRFIQQPRPPRLELAELEEIGEYRYILSLPSGAYIRVRDIGSWMNASVCFELGEQQDTEPGRDSTVFLISRIGTGPFDSRPMVVWGSKVLVSRLGPFTIREDTTLHKITNDIVEFINTQRAQDLDMVEFIPDVIPNCATLKFRSGETRRVRFLGQINLKVDENMVSPSTFIETDDSWQILKERSSFVFFVGPLLAVFPGSNS